MKDSTTTLLFLFAAIASLLAASWSQPTDATFEVSDLIGDTLFNPFETEAAKSLRIVRFEEEAARLSDFVVAEEDGVWSIPSKGGYPADAERQMAEATTGVIDLEILSVASQDATEHEDYGVVEPSENLEVGQTGVGTRVTLEDGKSEALVDVIIGKEVKGTTDQHYVRVPSRDVVYVVNIDPTKFSTTFEDWIEDDLLKLNTWDIARVQVKDYTAQPSIQNMRPTLFIDRRADLTLDYNDSDSEWTPNKLLAFDVDSDRYVEFELGENEVINEETLTELKNAVGDLKIVDVERKPGGLSADLRAGEDLFNDAASLQSLMSKGFVPIRGESGDAELLSTEGEVIITQKDGVEYLLRFGEQKLSDEIDTGEEPADEAEADSDIHRYLFVMARLNDSMIEPPEYETVPDEAPSQPEAEATGSSEQEEADSEESEEAEETTEADREEVLKRNQRLRDVYEKKVADAQGRVDELNDRFGDWYYLIADDVYKKVAVGRDELIKTEEPAEEEEDQAAEEDNRPSALSGLPNLPGVSLGSGSETEAAAEPAAEAAAEPAQEEEPATTEDPQPVAEATEAVEEPAE